MSHLDTAYKIGAALAHRDWKEHLKNAQVGTPPPAQTQPAPSPTPQPPPGVRAPGSTVPPPAPPGVVNPGPEAGLRGRGY